MGRDKMKIPKTVSIFGKKFKVKIVHTREFAGMMDSERSIIYLSAHQTKEEMLATYLHEAFHALHWRIGLNQALSKDMLEVLAESQSTLIMELFKLK